MHYTSKFTFYYISITFTSSQQNRNYKLNKSKIRQDKTITATSLQFSIATTISAPQEASTPQILIQHTKAQEKGTERKTK